MTITVLRKANPLGDTGHGVYENDAAADFSDELIRYLMSKVETIANSQYGMDPDESSSREMVAAIDLIYVIAKHTGAYLPERRRIQGWKDALFNTWDEYFESSPEYRNTKRIATVRRTFDKAIRYCDKCEEVNGERESS